MPNCGKSRAGLLVSLTGKTNKPPTTRSARIILDRDMIAVLDIEFPEALLETDGDASAIADGSSSKPDMRGVCHAVALAPYELF